MLYLTLYLVIISEGVQDGEHRRKGKMNEKFTWHFPEDIVIDPPQKPPRVKAAKGREMRALTDDELKRFLKVAERSGPRDCV
jgi:hypothetical protein